MKTVTYLANPTSPHVMVWLSLLAGHARVKVIHVPSQAAGDLGPGMDHVDQVSPLPGICARLPKIVTYVLLGIWLRLFHTRGDLLHAHNTSGYGLVALLAGRPYGITTYGTEIYSVEEQGGLYRWLIRRIIRGARFVTTASVQMNDALVRLTDCPVDKICHVPLGLKGLFLDPARMAPPATPRRWIVNRRIKPLYDTLPLVEGFKIFLAEGGQGHLTLLQGHEADMPYVDKVTAAIAGVEQITMVTDFLDPAAISALLDDADFAISIPRTDQMSGAILEGSARRAVPLLRRLPAYAPFDDIAIFVEDPGEDNGGWERVLADLFHQSAAMGDDEFQHRADAGRTLVETRFSEQAVRDKYLELLP